MMRYPSDRLHEEVAYLAYHLAWTYQEVMQLDHGERRRWVTEVARLNQRMAQQSGSVSQGSWGTQGPWVT
jgi:uncharacterized protein DUF6760